MYFVLLLDSTSSTWRTACRITKVR